ncbi:hypothetical protein V3C99_013199, partial [Haemonchus contortus]
MFFLLAPSRPPRQVTPLYNTIVVRIFIGSPSSRPGRSACNAPGDLYRTRARLISAINLVDIIFIHSIITDSPINQFINSSPITTKSETNWKILFY